jgi:hypothetical protein
LGLFALDVNAAKQAEERGQRELSRFGRDPDGGQAGFLKIVAG